MSCNSQLKSPSEPLKRIRFAGLADLGHSECNLWRAGLLATGLILLFAAIGWAEINLAGKGLGQRLVGNATEAATRYFTIPHVIVGFLFMVTAVKNRSPSRRIGILCLALVGIALCAVYRVIVNQYGVPMASVLLYSFFVIHDLRDESHFYQLLGDSPPIGDKARFGRFTTGLVTLTSLSFFIALWLSYTMRSHSRQLFSGISPAGPLAVAGGFTVIWVWAVIALFRWYGRQDGQNVWQVARAHRRLLRLFGWVILITAVGAWLTGRLFPIVLLHVSVWYVFTCRALDRRPQPENWPGLWSWMRGTPIGFRTLHVGLAVILVLWGALAVLDVAPASQLSWLISADALPYWTVMHISVSFVPR